MTTRDCEGCNDADWHGQQEPLLADTREQIIDPRTAYQIVSMLEGVVQRGTGQSVKARGQAAGRQDRHLARIPRTSGSSASRPIWRPACSSASTIRAPWADPWRDEQGATVAAPIFRDFMKGALADAPPTPFRVAPGIEEVPVDWKSGDPVPPGTPGAILEAFKAGTAPGEANAPGSPP